MSGPEQIVIAILTYNGYDLTRRALHTLTTLNGWPVPTAVIDNGSAAFEGGLLADELGPPVEAIRLSPNRGVAGGYNAGIRWAMSRGASHVLLLNNDIVASDLGLLAKLLAATGPHVAAVGPLTENSDGSTFSAGGRISLWTGLASHHRTPVAAAAYNVAWLDGPCLLLSLEALGEIGPLDESLWMYWEDVEWCLRANQLGWQCKVQPAARITHLRGGSNPRATAEAMSIRNRIRVVRRYGSGAQIAASTLFFLVIHAPVFIARRARRGQFLEAFRAVVGGCVWNVRDMIRGRSIRGAPPPTWLVSHPN